MPKHYAIADIHGMYNIYEQVCEMLHPDDIVYFLGDAADRGYACFKTMKAIYSNPQWIYLKGNHEDMMIKALSQHTTEDNNYYIEDNPMTLWFYNGGNITFNDWLEDGSDLKWINRLDHLSSQAEYTNEKGITFHMSHAGFTCGQFVWGEDLLWDRHHFFKKWDEEKYPNDICIHGHTPIEYLIKKLNYQYDICIPYIPGQPEAKIYCNGHKIDIDNGVFYTGATVLYDLDEMKAIPIYDKNFMKKKEEEEYFG